MKPIITVNNLVKKFTIPVKQSFWQRMLTPKEETFTAVNDISFTIGEGESVAFLGPNGAGKTTTMKMLTGILYPTAGDISVMGYTPSSRATAMLKNIGFVMGNKSTLVTDLSARQNYELNKVIYDIEPVEFYNTIDELSELLEVSEHLDRPIRKLSLGQRMKVEVIGSILHKPQILYLDEPTVGLDISSQNNIRNFLARIHKERNITILLTSHNMEDIEQVCERVIIINKGKLVYDDSLEKLRRSFSSKKYIKIIFGNKDADMSDLEKLGICMQRTSDSLTLEIDKNNQAVIIAEIMKNDAVQDIDIEGVPLSKIIEGIFKDKNL